MIRFRKSSCCQPSIPVICHSWCWFQPDVEQNGSQTRIEQRTFSLLVRFRTRDLIISKGKFSHKQQFWISLGPVSSKYYSDLILSPCCRWPRTAVLFLPFYERWRCCHNSVKLIQYRWSPHKSKWQDKNHLVGQPITIVDCQTYIAQVIRSVRFKLVKQLLIFLQLVAKKSCFKL